MYFKDYINSDQLGENDLIWLSVALKTFTAKPD